MKPTIRPITLRTREAMKDLGLMQALESEGEQTTALMGIAWVHTRPLPEVRAHIDAGTAAAAIEDFISGTPLEDTFPLIIPIRDQLRRIEAAAVAVMPKPGDAPEDEAPKN